MGRENIQSKTYDPVGCCIYCGSDGGEYGLCEEHIIPYSLGGNAVLPEASCRECEKITSYLDGYLARKVFGHHRIHANTQTRRPKQRPASLPANIIIDGNEDIHELAVPDHPYFTILPLLGEPGILAGGKPEDSFVCKAHGFYDIPPSMYERLNLDADVPVQVRSTGELNLAAFSRAIAKIAYCHWVAERGLDAIRPLVTPDLILGMYPHPSYFVGSAPGELPPPTLESLHTIDFATVSYGRLRLLVVSLRLFASSGTDEHGFPIYDVVIGAPKSF